LRTESVDRQLDELPLSRRELILIVVFWSFMAVLTAANRILDPRGLGPDLSASGGPAALAFIESYLWALLTPPIFWMSARFTPDRGNRIARVMLFVVVGIAVVFFVDATIGEFRGQLLPFPPRRGPGPGGPRGGAFGLSRFWLLNDFVVYMGALAAGLARAYSLRASGHREQAVRLESEAARLRAQLAEARLDALRMQLDPHFLFNTLHAISSLVERDPRGVRRMITRLSELLRHTIEGPSDQEIPLRQELDLLRRYLEIMEVRFQGRLQVRMEVDDRALDALVPNLVLQPIVENAIKHGVSRVEGVGHILVTGAVDGGDVVLRVENDGPESAEIGEPTSGSGVGVRNTRARLEHLYGTEQSFVLQLGPERTVAELRLPYHTNADLRTVAVAGTA
jgi:two-component sensor histidine kinase